MPLARSLAGQTHAYTHKEPSQGGVCQSGSSQSRRGGLCGGVAGHGPLNEVLLRERRAKKTLSAPVKAYRGICTGGGERETGNDIEQVADVASK